MTEKDIQRKIIRLYIDRVKEIVNFETASLESIKEGATQAFVSTKKDAIELEEILNIEICTSKILLPYIKKFISQPSVEKSEFIIDAIDFSSNFN
jgi:hypothetical protein